LKHKALEQICYKRDCVTAMKEGCGSPKLIIADPPYNYGQAYDAYDDKKSYDEYMSWTKAWMSAAAQALDPTGSMWIFVPDELVSELDVLAKHTLKLHKRQHVIWAFTFGQSCSNKFSRSHCHLLYYTKHKKKFTFCPDNVRVPSARQLVYKDKRATSKGKLPDDTWMLLESQLSPFMGKDRDTWLESRICGTFKDRHKHSPNQIPTAITDRIILSCSLPGDLVVDPFAGTGSSGVSCKRLGRQWVGFDVSALCVKESNKRIRKA
jgi:DNA modification methylase